MTRRTASSLFGFAPDGVYRDSVCCQTPGALLPHPFTLTIKLWRFAFCGTFPGVTPAGRYPASCTRWSPDFPHTDKLHAAVQPPDGG